MTDHLWPCGCLTNNAGAHRKSCPDWETIYPPNWTGDIGELAWREREHRTQTEPG